MAYVINLLSTRS